MFKFRHIIIILLFAANHFVINAQTNELRAGIRAGHNAIFGEFAAASVETVQYFSNDFSINGGIQYNTIGKTALEARPSYDLHFDWGELTAETMFSFNNFSSINSFAIGAGAKARFGWASVKWGYYYHIYGGKGIKVSEPFNLYYEFCAHLLKNVKKWDLSLIFTNCETFELDRHYQPSYIAECHHTIGDNLGLSLGIGYKPAGTFNITTDYYQTFIKTGICYRW